MWTKYINDDTIPLNVDVEVATLGWEDVSVSALGPLGQKVAEVILVSSQPR